MRLSKLCSGLSIALGLAAWGSWEAAARAQDPNAEAETLIADLRKIVEIRAASGWKIDRYEYEGMMPDALLSVCRTPRETQSNALAKVGRRVEILGGPFEEAFHKNGDKMDGLKDLLFATRVERLLREASLRALTECPVWMTPKGPFRGVQTDARKITLSGEGGGLGFIFNVDKRGDATLGGGGMGRLMLGFGLDYRWTVLLGVEVGGGALIQRNGTTTELPLLFQAAIPLVLRLHDVSWHYEVELGFVGLADEKDTRVSPGLRVGGLIGISTLRVRSFMPWFGLGGAMEQYLDSTARPAFRIWKGGARIGFNWDFSRGL